MSEFNKIIQLYPNNAFAINQVVAPFIDLVDQYAFDFNDLSHYQVLLITEFVDQELLFKHKEAISQFLDEKKIVIYCGQLFRDFIPGATLFMPKRLISYHDYEIKIATNSSIFKGVKADDLTYNKGVAGFNARGWYLPPKHAEISLTFKTGGVISYIDRETTKGTILVHAGRQLFGYKNQDKSTDVISVNVAKWVEDELTRLEGK
ncbi:hypothetical protein Hs30E_06780 [Lactococcus hodotermopsidis]|uniref:Phosphate starvation-inducible protein PhoH n=1 Tax=Pseudolactococcus hodotermopsidis TaxID=2709157 RepID=A0A6A0BE68_9LACT|nr:phosphate starvation-inducible protein PhoH [Lactococcus hodotermopsidis]GFH42127.1 hypothetical protein Hs30E_06780 [Lactococcus hodotermopsidis]